MYRNGVSSMMFSEKTYFVAQLGCNIISIIWCLWRCRVGYSVWESIEGAATAKTSSDLCLGEKEWYLARYADWATFLGDRECGKDCRDEP